MKRKRISKGKRERIRASHGHRCYICKAEERPTAMLEIDHWVPLFLGGADDEDNLRPLCPTCHTNKTRTENRVRGKIQRLSGKTKGRAKKSWPKKQSRWPKGRKIQSRGFQKKDRTHDDAQEGKSSL